MRKVMCPLINREIDGEGECFDIAMVAEDNAPAYTALQEAVTKENFKEICLKCPNHIKD